MHGIRYLDHTHSPGTYHSKEKRCILTQAMSIHAMIVKYGTHIISQDLFHKLSPFINHGSIRRSTAVGRSSGFHCKANRNHLRNPSTSSPWISAASLSNDRSGIGTRSFHAPDSSQKTQLMFAFFTNSGDGGPSSATSSAI